MVQGLSWRKIGRRALSRPGAICFVLVFSCTLIICRLKIARWESRIPTGSINFSGQVVDAGSTLPGHARGMRWQKLRLTDGTPVMIRTDLPARRGDRIEGKAHFVCAGATRNPGGFSERNWLWSKGTVWLARSGTYRLLTRNGLLLGLRRLPDRIRDFVRHHHEPLWKTPCGPLLLSLSTGETRLLEDRDSFFLRASGLSHLTSVSGTHLIFVLSPLLWITRKAKMSHRLRQWLSLPLILLPGLLSGWKSGISRASLVTFASRLDLIARQRRDLFNLLLFTGSVMLAFDPYALFDSSFWMSLSAAGAVSYTAKRLAAGSLPTIRSRLLAPLAFSAAAQLLVLPYQILTSPGIHLLAPLANMAAMPLAAGLMVTTYSAMLVLSFFPPSSPIYHILVKVFAGIQRPASDTLMWMSRMAARTHRAFIPLSRCLFLIPFLVLSVILLRGRRSRSAVALSLIASLACLFFLCCTPFPSRENKVLFLDVGQGDASLFITRSGQSFLIDGGDKKHGYNTVIPAARTQAVNFIDLAIVTHAHSDHAAGVAELIEAGFVGHLCLPAVDVNELKGSSHEEDMTGLLLERAEGSHVPVTLLEAGDAIRLGGCLIEVLHPDRRQGIIDLNESSLVMRVTMDGLSVLMTGDLTGEGEQSVLRSQEDCTADLLHVAHHGSRYSSASTFLEAAAPKTALISSGRDNRYGHPHPEVLGRLFSQGIHVLRTDERGAIFLKIREGKGRITSWLGDGHAEELRVGDHDPD